MYVYATVKQGYGQWCMLAQIINTFTVLYEVIKACLLQILGDTKYLYIHVYIYMYTCNDDITYHVLH